MIKFFTPLVIFLLIVLFFWLGLGRDPNLLPSMLIDKPIPAFTASRLEDNNLQITQNDLKGQITVLTIWTSHCVGCQIEHPILFNIAKQKGMQLYGMNYKDDREDALHFINKMGNPYKKIIYDPDGKIGMQWGVYGTPETFLIDKEGVIRYRFTGPISLVQWEKDLLPLIKSMKGGDYVNDT